MKKDWVTPVRKRCLVDPRLAALSNILHEAACSVESMIRRKWEELFWFAAGWGAASLPDIAPRGSKTPPVEHLGLLNPRPDG